MTYLVIVEAGRSEGMAGLVFVWFSVKLPKIFKNLMASLHKIKPPIHYRNKCQDPSSVRLSFSQINIERRRYVEALHDKLPLNV